MQGQTSFMPQQQFAPSPYPNGNVFGSGPEPQSMLGKRCREVEADIHCEPNACAGPHGGAIRIVPGPGPQANGPPPPPMNGTGMGMNMGIPGMPMPQAPGVFGGLKDGGMSLMNRSAGLEFAKLKKEEAREGFKEKRRMELVSLGEGDRTKRRRKNDTSMSENQKYRRRLKMNQDSAAAARYAQETYVATLEDLVQKFEMEKNRMSGDIGTLKDETFHMEQKIALLQAQLTQKRAAKQAKKAGQQNVQQNHSAPQVAPIAMQATLHQVPKAQVQVQPSSRPVAPASEPSMDAKSSEGSGISDFSTVTLDNDQGSTDANGADSIEFQSDMKKLGDMYDPSFMLSLGLDENLDFSNDIIDMHPIA